MYKNLGAYLRWVLGASFRQFTPPPQLQLLRLSGSFDGSSKAGVAHGFLLHRDGQYQTEVFAVHGPGEFPPHGHPHVDSFEVLVSGSIVFNVGGRWPTSGGCANPGTIVRVRRNEAHGARIAKEGAVFLSVQRWYDIEPHTVVRDWEGPEHIEKP